jgi:hypothetical protein
MLKTWFQRQKAQVDPDRMHVRREDTIFHTVLQTADAINMDGSSKAIDAATTYSSFPMQTTTEIAMSSDVDAWPLEQDEEMLPWNEFDFESFLDRDDSMLLQMALERLGGLIG